MSVDTYFAPVRRTDRREFKNQIVDISHSPLMNTLLKAVSGLMVVLNEDRQIVAINHAFLETIGIDNAEEVLGLRLGESLKCVHAHGEPNGCGTTLQCVTCGAAIATMAAIENDAADEQMCAMTMEKDGVKSDICLLIRSHPMRVDDRRWVLLFAQDITQEQFWMNLERIFFHDINNSLARASASFLSRLLSAIALSRSGVEPELVELDHISQIESEDAVADVAE